MFKKRQVVLSLEKDPPSVEDILKESIPIERKIEITKDVMSFGAGLYIFCRVIDTCGKIAVARLS
jgi:hypothetical protein